MTGGKNLFEVRQGAFIFNDNNQLLILKNKKSTWGIVGGHLEYNETAKEGLFREIKEETDLDVKFINYLNAIVKNKDFILVCVAKYKGGNIKLSHEHDDWKWVNLQDLNKYNLTFPQLPEEAKQALRIFLNQ
jgi:ADP-ribose pyrophosphatase YjhB (NUDIX family)